MRIKDAAACSCRGLGKCCTAKIALKTLKGGRVVKEVNSYVDTIKEYEILCLKPEST